MKIYKSVLNSVAPFVLCKQTVGKSYTWANEQRAGTRAIDLQKDDALILAKLLKLEWVELTNPDRLHVSGVLGMTDIDKVKIGVKPRLVGILSVSSINALDKVNSAIGGNEFFAGHGFTQHKNSLQKSLIVQAEKV